ncbi:hypothetical protein, partial [Xanthomonas phaseoli]
MYPWYEHRPRPPAGCAVVLFAAPRPRVRATAQALRAPYNGRMNDSAHIDYARYDHIRPLLWTG